MTKLQFRLHTINLLHEIADNALRPNCGVLKVPLNQFRVLLAEVAQRATELNDPKLNILMLRMTLYDVPNNEIDNAIQDQKNLFNP